MRPRVTSGLKACLACEGGELCKALPLEVRPCRDSSATKWWFLGIELLSMTRLHLMW